MLLAMEAAVLVVAALLIGGGAAWLARAPVGATGDSARLDRLWTVLPVALLAGLLAWTAAVVW